MKSNLSCVQHGTARGRATRMRRLLCLTLLIALAARDVSSGGVALLSKQEREHEEAFFRQVDADNDALLSRAELGAYFDRQQAGYSKDDLRIVVGYYFRDPDGFETDVDGDDRIDLHEFLALKVRTKQRHQRRQASRTGGAQKIKVVARDGKPISDQNDEL